LKILLLGESCCDEYHYGEVTRIAAEAPVPVLHYQRTEMRNGMAANVRANLAALGATVDFVTNHPSQLIKRRFVDTRSNQLLLRQDIEGFVQPATLDKLTGYDALVISDYAKGLIDPNYIKSVCAEFDGPTFVDSKRTDLSCFDNSFLKVNELEAAQIKKLPTAHQLITTLGKRGATWNNQLFAAPPVDVFDVTGAGDVFLAAFAYYYLQTSSLPISTQLAVLLSSKSVQHMGIYTLSADDVQAAEEYRKTLTSP
jgi:bifunctional ADP-heptose synthase (sugar kinase/adenylyltransferase)